MGLSLASGCFFGRTLASRATPHLHVVLQRHEQAPGGTTPLHGHASPYLALVARGAFREFIGTHEQMCTPGSLALDTSGEEHYDVFEAQYTELINVELAPSWLEPLREERPFDPSLTWINRRDLAGRARVLRSHLERPEALSALVVEGVAAELLLLALGPGQRRWRGGTPPSWLAAVEEVLRAQFRDPPALAELARLVDRSPSQLARVFRRWRGVSLGGFARRVRVEHARRALLETSASLLAISRDAGYSDQSHMTRELGTLLGCTPGRLRRDGDGGSRSATARSG